MIVDDEDPNDVSLHVHGGSFVAVRAWHHAVAPPRGVRERPWCYQEPDGAGLIVAVVLAAANASFVAAEFSIARLRPTQLEPVFGQEARIVGIGPALSRTGPIALALAPPMRAFHLATKPVVDLFNALGELVIRPFGIPPASEAGHVPHSEDELRQLLRESQEGGLIQADESRISEAALISGDRRAARSCSPAPRSTMSRSPTRSTK